MLPCYTKILSIERGVEKSTLAPGEIASFEVRLNEMTRGESKEYGGYDSF